MPLDHLLVVVLVVTAPSIRVNETTKGVSAEVSTMRVHFPSGVVGPEVGLCLVDKTDDLNVVWGSHELNTLEGATWDETSAMARLGTPRDGLVLGFTNSGGTIRGGPHTEIWKPREIGERLFDFSESLRALEKRAGPSLTQQSLRRKR